MQNSLLNTHVTTIDGEVTTLEKYAGKVLLIVNVASRCGLTAGKYPEGVGRSGVCRVGFSLQPVYGAGARQRRAD